MRFFLHLRNATECIDDHVGFEQDDLVALRRQVLEAVAEFRSDIGAEIATWAGWRLEVTNAMGAAVAVVSIDPQDGSYSPSAP